MKQAQGAIRQSPKGYADGGKVVSPWSFKGIYNTAKGALAKSPEQEEKDAALADYKARAQAERNPAPQPAPTPGISSYVANTALQAREKAAGLKAGGAVRGKGTGTSDEVPIMASNGEFVIKAKAVKAIGLEVLEALNTIADKPDEKDSKAEAMREYGDGSESPVHEKAEEKVEGFKCGGAVRKMATGGLVETNTAIGVYGPNPMDTNEIARNMPGFWGEKRGEEPGTMPGLDYYRSKMISENYKKIHPNTANPVDETQFILANTGQPMFKSLESFRDDNQAIQRMDEKEKSATIAKEMATGVPHMREAGSVDDAQKRAQMLAQIPTGGTGVGPTPQPDPTQSASGTELGRNVNNAINAIPAGMMGRGMVAGGAKIADALVGSEKVGRLAAGALKVGPYAVPAASAVGLGMASSQSAAPTAPVQKPAGALPASQPSAPAPTTAPVPGGDIPTPPVQATPMLNGQAGKDVGYGTTRFDVPGKSPLFTNMTDAAGMVSNEKLINRGAISQQNQTAMDNLTARYKAEAVGMAQAQINAEQNARESMAADASNKGAMAVTEAISNRTSDERARWDAELKLSSTLAKKEEKVAAQRTLDALNQKANQSASNAANNTASMDRTMVGDSTTRRGQDITAQGQAVQAGALRQSQQLARDRFGIEKSQESRAAAKDALDAKQRDRLQAAFDAYDKDPSEKAAERVRVLMGKEKAAPPDSWGIRKVTAADGSVTEIPYNKHTGEDRASQQAKAALPSKDKLVKGQTYQTARGPATWDGSNFTPVQ